jgi:hypothetical protein
VETFFIILVVVVAIIIAIKALSSGPTGKQSEVDLINQQRAERYASLPPLEPGSFMRATIEPDESNSVHLYIQLSDEARATLEQHNFVKSHRTPTPFRVQ